MIKIVTHRILWLVPMLLLVSVVTFGMLSLAGGNVSATILGDAATPQAIAQKNHELGLDRSDVVQYVDWLGSAVRGDLGRSFIDNSSVSDSLDSRFPITLWLTLGGLVVAILLGIPSGILAATRPGGLIDRAVTVFTSIAVAIPGFWIGMLGALFIGVRLGWVPPGGYVPLGQDPVGWAQSMILPWIALGAAPAGGVARQMRAAMVTALESDYVRTARAKGMSLSAVIRRHALRNSWGPVATILGFQIASMIGGSFVIEAIFSLPGIGGMVIPAVQNNDYPVLLGVVTVIAVVVLLVNLVVDIIYSYADPRVRA